jgi:hypothetical protein
MIARRETARPVALAVALAVARAIALLLTGALAVPASAEEGAEWRLEQPLPPKLADGQESKIPIGLGKVGDIEFWGPNRGLLITAGNPPTIPPGIWAYNGREWHELASKCGATDGRIAWAGPDEFWTVSDGRPGQASTETTGNPPLADNTLCHFQKAASERGEVAGSYGSLAFRPDSYQAMHAAGCIAATDCWFAGDPLPEGQVGAFHLHWDGSSLTEVPNPQGHGVQSMSLYEGLLYESVRLLPEDLVAEPEPPLEPSVLHLVPPLGTSESPFLQLTPGVPQYAPGEFPTALDHLQLSADEEALWGAASPAERLPSGSAPSEVTIVRDAGGLWSQLVGSPSTDPPGGNPFAGELVDSIAAEPGSESAWLAMTSSENRQKGSVAPAIVSRVWANQTVSDRQTLPTPQEAAEGVGPKGVADKITCPAPDDCWLVTAQGWLFHYADAAHRTLGRDSDPAFSGLINFRPQDAGVPALVPDAPPVDDSGLLGERNAATPPLQVIPSTEAEATTTVPLVSRIRTRLIHGTTLELSFHLATKARVRLLAKRQRKLVASTPMRIFSAGSRKLDLRLSRRRWPTKLDLQARALGALPTTSLRGAGSTTVGTAFHELQRTEGTKTWESFP